MSDGHLDSDSRLQELARENARLSRAVEELSVLNELAAEMGRARGFEEMTQSIIRKARRAAGAQEAVINLVDEASRSELRTLVRTRVDSRSSGSLRPSEQILQWMHRNRSPFVVGHEEESRRREFGLDESSIQSLLSVPMMVGGRLIGILTVYNRERGADFTGEDVRLLSIMAAQSAQLIDYARIDEERRAIVQTFGQYTSPEIVEEILRHGSETEGMRRRVCVLFMDVRGFSAYAERANPEAVVRYLRSLFDVTIDCVNAHDGIVHQLLGDGLMAIFGAPVSSGRDAQNAVRASLEMLDRVERSMEKGELSPRRLGIGLHFGDVIAGTIGSSIHREYKVTGDVVNVAARVEQLNKKFDSRLLITEAVYREIDESELDAEDLGEVVLRGREEPVRIFRLA